MISRRIVKVTRPDGTRYIEEFKDIETAFERYRAINLCRGWSAEIYAHDGAKWVKL